MKWIFFANKERQKFSELVGYFFNANQSAKVFRICRSFAGTLHARVLRISFPK